MEQILASIELGGLRSLHIGTLADDTIKESGADHLGLDGYFIFEVSEKPGYKGIDVLAKASSLEAAFSLIGIWRDFART